jgi:flavin-binding protein dodecin
MSVVKVVELLAQSEESWEDATRQAVQRAAQTLRNIRSVYVKEFEAVVENGEVTLFRANCKISFVLESGQDVGAEEGAAAGASRGGGARAARGGGAGRGRAAASTGRGRGRSA